LCSARSQFARDPSSPWPSCALCASWRLSSDFASRTWPRGFSAAAAAATPAAFPITSPHELPVGSTSDVAAPAGAEISRSCLVLHAAQTRVQSILALPFLRPLCLLVAELRLCFAYLASWIFHGCSRGHTCCVSDHLAARTSRVLHLRCGCAGRRGDFTLLPCSPRGPAPRASHPRPAPLGGRAPTSLRALGLVNFPRLLPRPHRDAAHPTESAGAAFAGFGVLRPLPCLPCVPWSSLTRQDASSTSARTA